MEITMSQNSQCFNLMMRDQIDHKKSQTDSEMIQSHDDHQSRCNNLQCTPTKILLYCGVICFLIQSIVYIGLQYGVVKKYHVPLRCKPSLLVCFGEIANIYTQSSIFFQLSARHAPKEVNIKHIRISNETHVIQLGLREQEQPNVYMNFRRLYGVIDENLAYRYNITVIFEQKVPREFLQDLVAIIRQDSKTTSTDDYSDQIIYTLVLTFLLFIYNFIHKLQRIPDKKHQKEDEMVVHRINCRIPQQINTLLDQVNGKYLNAHKMMLQEEEIRTLTANSEDEIYYNRQQ